jgi:prepilin-type processing-associated H-X9-DG protein
MTRQAPALTGNRPTNSGEESIFFCQVLAPLTEEATGGAVIVPAAPGETIPSYRRPRFLLLRTPIRFKRRAAPIASGERCNGRIHSAKSGQGISSRHATGANALIADGSVRFVPENLSASELFAWLTAHAGDLSKDF